MTYSGIIFDFDGVIVDSERQWLRVEGNYLKKMLPSWKDKDYSQLVGSSLPDAYTMLQAHGLPLTYRQYSTDYELMALEIYGHLKTLPGLEALLKELKTNHARIAIASSSKRSWINLFVKNNKIKKYFESISSAHDPLVENGKPAPDVFLAAARSLGELPSRLIAIEDSTSGVAASKAAGMFCIGFRGDIDSRQNLDCADIVVDDFSPENRKLIVGLVG